MSAANTDNHRTLCRVMYFPSIQRCKGSALRLPWLTRLLEVEDVVLHRIPSLAVGAVPCACPRIPTGSLAGRSTLPGCRASSPPRDKTAPYKRGPNLHHLHPRNQHLL